jgi:hypothetical protein
VVTKKIVIFGEPCLFHIHRGLDYAGAHEVFLRNKIDCIRIYEMFSFDFAERLAKNFSVPFVVSIH